MPGLDDSRDAAVKPSQRANTPASEPRLLVLVERWLRPADRLDYLISRWIGAVPSEVNRSMPRRASMPNDNLLSEIPMVIGRYLRAEYDLAQPIPLRLIDLVEQLEQGNPVSKGRAQ